MMEQKLQQAADALPEPELDYLAVEEAWKNRNAQPKQKPKRLRLAILVCLALLLVGCVAGPTVPEYHLYNGSLSLLFPGLAFDDFCDIIGHDPELNSAKKVAEELGWTIPDTLGGSPCYGADKFNLTTQESHWFIAMLFHHYTYHSVDYGYEMITEVTVEDGHQSDAHWTKDDVRITFGSMDNEVWRRQFHFGEDDVWVAPEGSVDVHSLKYEGFTLYVSTYPLDSDFFGLLSQYLQRIYWMDYDHNTVFSLTAQDDTPDFVIACAKELIDQMH